MIRVTVVVKYGVCTLVFDACFYYINKPCAAAAAVQQGWLLVI